jgi:hypothetical protein
MSQYIQYFHHCHMCKHHRQQDHLFQEPQIQHVKAKLMVQNNNYEENLMDLCGTTKYYIKYKKQHYRYIVYISR